MINQLSSLVLKSNRLRVSFALLLSIYIVLWLLWLVFRFFVVELSQTYSFDTWFSIFYLQHKFNLRFSALVIIPILILVLIPKRVLSFNSFRFLTFSYFSLIVITVLLFYIFNWGYFVYLARPIDVSVLRFLEDRDIATDFIWQSYPVIAITIVWLFASFFLIKFSFWIVKKLILAYPTPTHGIKKRFKFLAFIIIFFLIVGALFGRLSQYPLRWSEAFFSADLNVAYLSLNPVLYFYQTLKNKHEPYDLEKTQDSYPLVADFLGIKPNQQNKHQLNYQRWQPQRDKNQEQFNVVFIMLESLGANRLGIYGNLLSPTPNLDAIAHQGYFFPNFFVPNNGTARTIFTSLFGISDVSPIKTASRNPLIIDQTTLMTDYKNYQKHYLIGGSASWANIRAMLKFNIPDLQIYEGDYQNTYPKIDVWGISDTDLFQQANETFENEAMNNNKFIAYIQTAGNHRPFTIPDDNKGFKKQIVSEEFLKEHGFYSLAQFNGIRFLDHNIGYFFKLFEKSSYYGKTIFVLFGDHNDRTYDAFHMRALEHKTELDALHVPMIIYAPGIIKSKVFHQAASLVDVFPTVSDLANVEVINTTMGKNLLKTDENHLAFTLRGNMLEPNIGVVQGDYYFRDSSTGNNPELFDLTKEQYSPLKIDASNQALFDYLHDITHGIFHTSRYLLHRNLEQ